MATLEKALKIALEAHQGQKDKAGAEYIFHPIRVMQRGKTMEEKICGLLHDVIEDSHFTFEDLIQEGFSNEIIEALKCLTKKSDEEDYDSFIERILQNPLAVQVKINDLLDNLDVTRYKKLTEKDLERLNRYLKAYWKLVELQK